MSFGRILFRLRDYTREPASELYNMAIRHSAKATSFATDAPWRLKEAYRRHSQQMVQKQTPQTTPGIRCMAWNASKSLVHDEFLHWCNSQPLDIIALQEIGWNFNVT